MAAEQNNDTRTNAQSARLESEHTPGPWRNERGSIRATINGEDVQIAGLFRTSWTYPDQHKNAAIRATEEGDARLIAAAPDMFEALKAWEFARREGGISHADFFEAAWQKTAAAIAKAEAKEKD